MEVVSGTRGSRRRVHERAAVGPDADRVGPQVPLRDARLVQGRERERQLGAEVERASRGPGHGGKRR